MSDFWQKKPVLVTGADGFIGSHLVERLAEAGAKVRAFAYYNSFANLGNLEMLPKAVLENMEIVSGDIRDSNQVARVIDGCEVVFHLASLIAIPYSYDAPGSYVQTNVCGTLNVLNACRKHGVKRMVHTSTSEVYGTAQYVPIDEKHPLQAQSPYSASKIGADALVESYWRSFDLPVSVVRPFNTFGPRQTARAVIPTIISQLLAGAKQIKLGALSPSRDFNYVADTVDGFLAVGESEKTLGKVINIGSGRDISIGDLAELIMQTVDRKVPIVQDQARLRPDKSEVDRLCCDSSLARELTNWQPRVGLEQGLAFTADWIGRNLDKFDPDVYEK